MTAHAYSATADIAHEPSRAYEDHGQHSMDEKKATNIGGVDVACFEVFVDTHLKRGSTVPRVEEGRMSNWGQRMGHL